MKKWIAHDVIPGGSDDCAKDTQEAVLKPKPASRVAAVGAPHPSEGSRHATVDDNANSMSRARLREQGRRIFSASRASRRLSRAHRVELTKTGSNALEAVAAAAAAEPAQSVCSSHCDWLEDGGFGF